MKVYKDGKYRHVLENDNGMKVSLLEYGCVVEKIVVPNRDGVFENVVLGHEDIEDYRDEPAFFGAVVGRVAGRIKESKFSLNGIEYVLPSNDGRNHLHGNGEFSNVFWNAEDGTDFVKFTYTSPDGKNGYPGEVRVQVTYSLNNENELRIEYEATSSKDTILNLTNHSYFNLSGNFENEILSEKLYSPVSNYVELRDDLIPTGNLPKVDGTKFDFSREHSISEEFDHALILDCKGEHLARLSDERSGRVMTMATNYPCYVLYTGNFLAKKHTGVCLEAQFLPDAINHENFGNVVLKAGEKYSKFVCYKFDIE